MNVDLSLSQSLDTNIGNICWKCLRLEKHNIVTIIVYIIFFLSCMVTYLIYYFNEKHLSSFHDSPIYIAFNTPTYIYFALIVNISIYLPSLLDLILDWRNNRDLTFQDEVEIDDEHNSLFERAFMAFINIAFGLILLLLRNDKNFAYFYVAVHVPQFVGNLGVVLVLCRKLIPEHFTAVNILGSQLSLALATTTAYAVFGQSDSWSTILVFVSTAICAYFLVFRITRPWFMDLSSRVLFGKESLTIGESCALWYFLSTVFLIVMLPGAALASSLFKMEDIDIYDVCTVLFCFSIFGIIVNTVPGRLARNAVDREKKKILQMKKTLVRYMGHEVRSPLNVLISGLKLLQTDISKLQSREEEKTSLLESVASMQQVSDDLLKTMNDLLHLEKIESSAFAVEEKIVSCLDLLKMSEKYNVSAREKGIHFTVRSELDQRQPSDLSTSQQLDIERGGFDDIKEDDSAALCVSIDELKIGQVIRNLITNAIKFTPAEKPVSVTLRHATSADLAEEERARRGKKLAKNVKERAASVERSGYSLAGHVVFEVADAGAGIAQENWSKVFDKSEQFNANMLQGGGGSGLGLWISQEIVKHHGSRIRFCSEGEGGGTRFYFILPCYKVNAVQKEPVVTAASPSPAQLWPRVAQISPELESIGGAENDKFSGIAWRPLNRPGQCKVLVVDDSKVNNKILIKVLKQIPIGMPSNCGGQEMPTENVAAKSDVYLHFTEVTAESTTVYSFAEADDGSSAVQKVQEANDEGAPFDIVFMDNIMVRMNGPEAAELMRSAGFRGLVVGVTGNVMAHDVEHYVESGADCVLQKPVNVEELKQILQRFY